MKKAGFFFMFLLISNLHLWGQDPKNAIERFKNTDFMVKFMDLRNQIQEEATEFISNQNQYTKKDVKKVQLAYGKTVSRFNQVMLDIKSDFLDKKKLKTINQYPQMYSDGLKSKIDELENFYKENFNLAISEVTEKNGVVILDLLIGLITSSSELTSYFKGVKYEKQAMNETYIQTNLIEPTKFASWSELSNTTTIKPAPEKIPTSIEEKTEDVQPNKNKNDNTTDTKETNEPKEKEEQVKVDDKSTIVKQQPIKTTKPIVKKSNKNQ